MTQGKLPVIEDQPLIQRPAQALQAFGRADQHQYVGFVQDRFGTGRNIHPSEALATSCSYPRLQNYDNTPINSTKNTTSVQVRALSKPDRQKRLGFACLLQVPILQGDGIAKSSPTALCRRL